MSIALMRCSTIIVTLTIASSAQAAPIYLTFNFDSAAADSPGDTLTDTNGVYNVMDDYAAAGNGTTFVANDTSAQPLITLSIIGNGASLDTNAGGIGVDDGNLDSGEFVDISFDMPVYVTGLSSDPLTGTDSMVYSANSGVNGGFETALLGDDGNVTTNFFLAANDPLRVISLNGSFSLASLSIQLPEPSPFGGAIISLAMLTMVRRRRRGSSTWGESSKKLQRLRAQALNGLLQTAL